MIRKIKILLVDDHIVVRNGIKLMLSQQKSFVPEIIEAGDAEEVIQLTNNTSFDVILLDINLPGQNGISITKYLTKKSSNYKILALTMHKEEYMVKQMISAGAMGYLLKNTGLDELTKAIMTVASSNKYYCNEASQVLINDSIGDLVSQKKHYNLTVDYTSTLSNREKEVMMFIVKELSSVQIAEKLFISKRTVDTHRKNIIAKLKLKNTAGIVKYAIEHWDFEYLT
jgi:DNA-binding NarL/FixJ family response regulator